MRRVDLRPKWDESPELRDAVESDLRNWSVWSRGGWPRLDCPTEQPFSRSPQDPSPPMDVRRAEQTEEALVLWRLLARDLEERKRTQNLKLITALKLHYLTDKAAHTKAKILHVSRPTYYRMLDEARFAYWVMSDA